MRPSYDFHVLLLLIITATSTLKLKGTTPVLQKKQTKKKKKKESTLFFPVNCDILITLIMSSEGPNQYLDEQILITKKKRTTKYKSYNGSKISLCNFSTITCNDVYLVADAVT